MAEQATIAAEPLTLRLARLNTWPLRENEHKVIIAEAVEALHEAELQVERSAASFAETYQRKVLDFVGASADVDLESVIITSGYEPPWQTSYDGGGGFFAFYVQWGEKKPRNDDPILTPDWRGLYMCYRQLTNDDVSKLLDSLFEG